MKRARPGRNLLLATASLAALVPAALLAQEGTGARGTFSFATGLEFSDNKRLDPVTFGDTITSVTDLGFVLESETRSQRLRFAADGRLEGSSGDGATIEDEFRLSTEDINLGYVRLGANSRLSFDAGYSRNEVQDDFRGFFIDGNFDPQALLVDGGEVDRQRFRASIETGLEGPLGLELTALRRDRNYRETSDPNLSDLTFSSLEGIARFRTRPDLSYRARLGATREEEVSIIERESDVDFIGFGVETETAGGLTVIGDVLIDDVEAKTEGITTTREDGVGIELALLQDRLNGGYGANFTSRIDGAGRRTTASVSREFEFPTGAFSFSLGVVDQRDGDAGFTAGLDFFRQTPIGRVTANITQRPTTRVDEAFLNTSISLGIERELSPVSEIGATFRYGRSRGLTNIDDDINSRTQLGVTYTRDITKDWGFVAGYEYTATNDDDVPRATRNTFFFNIGRDFDFGF